MARAKATTPPPPHPPTPQQSGAQPFRTADSSALLEWRNKLIQHYWADSKDESGQTGSNQGWWWGGGDLRRPFSRSLWGKSEGWGGGGGDNTSHPIGASYYDAVLSSVWDNAALAATALLTTPTKTSAVSASHSHLHRPSVPALRRSGTFSRE